MQTRLEEMLRAGSYYQVRKEADRMIQEENLSIREQGAALRLACRARLCLADYYAAAKLGEQAAERAREAGDINTLGMAHFDLGVAYTHIGDTHKAEQNLQSFLALHPQMTGVEAFVGRAYYHLALIHRQRKQWATAIHTLERAADLLEAQGQKAEQTQCALDVAWCYLMLGAYSLATPYLAQVEDHLQQDPDDTLTADLICLKALCCRLEGDIATSAQLCQEIFVPGRLGIMDQHLGEASWIMGENALDLGRLEEAQVFVDMALNHAARANRPSLMNRACDLRRRIACRMAA